MAASSSGGTSGRCIATGSTFSSCCFSASSVSDEYSSLTELALKQQEENVEPVAMQRPEVPPELDAAIRVALSRAPESRYGNALEMGQALEAGLHGHATEATRQLTDGPDRAATQVLGGLTEATQALRTRQAPTPPPPTRPPPQRRQEPERKRQGRRWGPFLALLAVLAVVVAVSIALLSANSPGPQPVDKGDVQQQIDGVRQFLQDRTR